MCELYFFFKQKTAYEMRISDWSSDVCSSDLIGGRLRRLSKKMKDAKVLDPAEQPDKSRAYFGATVTVADEDDNHRTVTLVGDDEADASAGRIGWNADRKSVV